MQKVRHWSALRRMDSVIDVRSRRGCFPQMHQSRSMGGSSRSGPKSRKSPESLPPRLTKLIEDLVKLQAKRLSKAQTQVSATRLQGSTRDRKASRALPKTRPQSRCRSRCSRRSAQARSPPPRRVAMTAQNAARRAQARIPNVRTACPQWTPSPTSGRGTECSCAPTRAEALKSRRRTGGRQTTPACPASTPPVADGHRLG